jgi:predicted Zn-dependent protease with MMP-like domain
VVRGVLSPAPENIKEFLPAFGVLPDKITIFQKPIEMSSEGGKENLAVLVREVVWHEIGHHFGLSDLKLHLLEKKWKKENNAHKTD